MTTSEIRRINFAIRLINKEEERFSCVALGDITSKLRHQYQDFYNMPHLSLIHGLEERPFAGEVLMNAHKEQRLLMLELFKLLKGKI